MTHSNEVFDLALERLLAGEATAEEHALVEQRAATDPVVARLLASLRHEFTPPAPGSATDAAWVRLQSRMHAEPVRDIATARSKRFSQRFGVTPATLVRIAATLLVVVGAAVVSRRAQTPRLTRVTVREIATTKAQRATFQLADGTRVMLDVDSKLRVEMSARTGARNVYLTGEAFFQVTHDEKRPFRVHARNAVTTVLGTEFGVRAYPGTPQVLVALRSGAVSLRAALPNVAGVTLTPGQLGSIDSLGHAVVQPDASAESMLGWTTGKLVLADVSVREAVEQLARWYDARIVVDDSRLAARRINASFKDEPVTQALEAISLSLGARVTRIGDTFHISAARGGQ